MPEDDTQQAIAARPQAILPLGGNPGLAALVTAGPLVLIVLSVLQPPQPAMLHAPAAHVLIAGGASFLGAALALLVLRTAIRARDARVFLVGMGFLSIASIFFIHSIATPDVLMVGRGLATQWSGLLSLIVGGIFFALSGIPFDEKAAERIIANARIVLVAFLVGWALYAGAVLLWPPLIRTPAVATANTQAPANDDDDDYGTAKRAPAKHTSTAPTQPGALDRANSLAQTFGLPLILIGLGCYIVAALRHFQIYRSTRSQAGIALTCGIVLLGEALLAQQLADAYTPIFWLYHVLEFIGFGVISYAVLFAYRRGQRGGGFLEGLFLSGTRARIRGEYTLTMDALIATLSRSEQPTSELRQMLRERLGLSETQVQVLEHAAAAVAQERRQRQELEQLNAELVRAEQTRDQITQMVVHDLKNPLTGLLGFLDMLRLDALTADQKLLVTSALRSGRNLTGLIDDLLDVSRMEQGHFDPDHTLIRPFVLLHDCAAQMRGWSTQVQKQIIVDADPDLPLLDGDARLLRRVLLNLISNAIKHNPPGTTITLAAAVEAHDDKHAMVVQIADDGDGISAELLPQIFERYTRGRASTTEQQSSTGLGLTFCRMAVEAHGGTITVVSAPDEGTTFTLRLPLIGTEAPALTATPVPQAIDAGFQS